MNPTFTTYPKNKFISDFLSNQLNESDEIKLKITPNAKQQYLWLHSFLSWVLTLLISALIAASLSSIGGWEWLNAE